MRNNKVLLLLALMSLSLTKAQAEPFREVAPAVFQSGLVQVDAKKRTATFPAKVNMAEGVLEYGIVTPAGSVHESLLVSEVDPLDLNAAFLLLGLKGNSIEPAPHAGGGLNSKTLAAAPDLAGAPVRIFVRWEARGAPKREPLSDWVLYRPEGKAAKEGPWSYTGSYFVGNAFAAASEGAILCLVTNAAALLNNPRQGRKNDQAWEANSRGIPPVGTVVTIEVEMVKVDVSQP
jgi:hypothetical protein